MPPQRRSKPWSHCCYPFCPSSWIFTAIRMHGGTGEQHCHNNSVKFGFQLFLNALLATFTNNVVLFRWSTLTTSGSLAPLRTLQEGSSLFRNSVCMGAPTPLGKYLGSSHTVVLYTLDLFGRHLCYRWPLDNGAPTASRGAFPAWMRMKVATLPERQQLLPSSRLAMMKLTMNPSASFNLSPPGY